MSPATEPAGDVRRFYERRAAPGGWAQPLLERPEARALAAFVARHGLERGRVLEIGSGTGEFQDVVAHWFGVDLAHSAGRLARKPFAVASAQTLPFKDGSFDAVWSIAVLEHVPDPEVSLQEIERILTPGGVAYLAPAWHCRPWAAEGIHVRPWSDLTWRQRAIKTSIPLRESLWFRGTCVLPGRLWRELQHAAKPRRALRLRYGRLTANYEHFWASDSDACSVLDPHDTLLWFVSRGWEAVSHPHLRRRFVARHGAIVVRKP
jgi:SAM-dependent methyltransferase